MKRKQKLIALLLAAALVIGLVPFAALADDGDGTYAIDATAGQGGTISAGPVGESGSAEITVRASDGYELTAILVDGVSVALPLYGEDTITVEDVQADVTVRALFAESDRAFAERYDDVNGDDWFYPAVDTLTGLTMVQGVSDDAFEPERDIKRSEFAQVMFNLATVLGLAPEEKPDTPFTDMPRDDYWAVGVIGWAYDMGIIEGYSETAFGPEDPMSRQDMALAFYRFLAESLGYELEGDETRDFADADEVDDWATDAVDYVVRTGLMQGYEEDGVWTFQPTKSTYRDEIAQMFYNYLISIYALFPDSYPDWALSVDDEAAVEAKVEALIKTMTQEEKFSLLGGSGTGDRGNAGDLPGVPRLGVPMSQMHDGPAGVYSVYDTTNPPLEQMVAATWSEELAYDYGVIHGSENRALGANMQLGAQYDITRTPYFGRAKDQFGEDPFLLSRMAVGETNGIQDQNVIAVAKHYAVFSQDATPGTNTDIVISEQAIHEIHLPGFEAAVKEAGVLGMMSSYNRVNGTYASANSYLQLDVLRDMWGYKGFTVTDWGGNDGFTLDKGTDIEMPSLSTNTQEAAEALIESGAFTQETVDQAAANVLYALGQAGYLGLVQVHGSGYAKEEAGRTEWIDLAEDTETLAQIREENSSISREIAESGGVLLKNEDNVLPLDTSGDKTVAVIGLNGMNLISGIGGERSYGTVSKMTSPYEELVNILGEDKVEGQVALDILGTTIPAGAYYVDETGSENGVVRTYGVAEAEGTSTEQQGQWFGTGSVPETAMEGHEIGEPAGTDDVIDFNTGTIGGKPNRTYLGENADPGTATSFPYDSGSAYTWTTYIMAPEDGEYTIGFHSIGLSASAALTLEEPDAAGENGRTVTLSAPTQREGAQWYSSIIPDEYGMSVSNQTVTLEAGKLYKLEVKGVVAIEEKDMQLRMTWITPSQKADNYNNAMAAAANHDTVVVFAWQQSSTIGSSIETSTLALDAEQEQLILDAAQQARANGNKVVVVLNNATAVTMENWIDQVDGLLEMYFPGQEGGIATARLLTGEVNPSGKLAYTIPKKDTDTLLTYSQELWDANNIKEETDDDDEDDEFPFPGFGGGGGKNISEYNEGIMTGYRWYDDMGIDPEYAFGYGLSYTDFTYSGLSIVESREDDELAGFDVTFTVTNTGSVTGTEIAQVYLGEIAVPDGVQMAKVQLAGFERIEDIAPGESRTVTVHVSERSLSYWDTDSQVRDMSDGTTGKWTLATGTRTVYVGASSRDLILSQDVTIQ